MSINRNNILKINSLLFIVASLFLYSCSENVDEPQKEEVKKSTDYSYLEKAIDKDLQNRKTKDSLVDGIPAVKIGNQIWSAYNLNVTQFRNGDQIKRTDFTGEETIPAWTLLTSDKSNGKLLGRMYNLAAINDPRGLAPKGWHIPTREEWSTLNAFLGDVPSYKVKSTVGWIDEDGLDYNGSNEAKMYIYPGGSKVGPAVESEPFGLTGFWTATSASAEYQYVVQFFPNWDLSPSPINKKGAYYIRLVHD